MSPIHLINIKHEALVVEITHSMDPKRVGLHPVARNATFTILPEEEGTVAGWYSGGKINFFHSERVASVGKLRIGNLDKPNTRQLGWMKHGISLNGVNVRFTQERHRKP